MQRPAAGRLRSAVLAMVPVRQCRKQPLVTNPQERGVAPTPWRGQLRLTQQLVGETERGLGCLDLEEDGGVTVTTHDMLKRELLSCSRPNGVSEE